MVTTDIDMPTRISKAMEQGASYCLGKPFDSHFLTSILSDIAAKIDSDNHAANNAGVLHSIDQFGQLRGSSPAMRKLYRTLRKVSATNASLFVVGESGTGKELVARTAHGMNDKCIALRERHQPKSRQNNLLVYLSWNYCVLRRTAE